MKYLLNCRNRLWVVALLLPLFLAVGCADADKTNKNLMAPDDIASDTTAPETVIDSGSAGTISNSDVTFTFSCDENNCTFECALDAAAFASCPSPQSYTDLADGAHNFAVRALDQAGNMDETPASQGFTIDTTVPDTTPPDTAINSGPSGTITNNDVSFTFSCDEATCTYECQLDTGSWTACTSPQNYTGLADGTHTFRATAADLADNTDASPASRTFVVNTTVPDTTAPQTLIDRGPSALTNDTAADFSFSCDEDSCTYGCQLNAGGWSICTSPKIYTGLADASYTFEVRAIDAANNTDLTPASHSWTVNSAMGSPVTVTSQLPDTGQSTCYDDTAAMTCPGAGQAFYGQDAQYTTNIMSLADNGTVSDNVTSLIWEQKTAGNKNTTYTWQNALNYCSGLVLGGYSDWRLPNEYELQSIVDYGSYNPPINTTYFPNVALAEYWSSSIDVGSGDAWFVRFTDGYVFSYGKTSSIYARCVRGIPAPAVFADNGDGTVSDSTTGLMWEQKTTPNKGTTYTWQNGLAYCENLVLAGHSDWRLPDIKELRSIVDNTVYNPSINTTVFPNTVPFLYWSSSTYAGSISSAWIVGIYSGGVSSNIKTGNVYVRCVR